MRNFPTGRKKLQLFLSLTMKLRELGFWTSPRHCDLGHLTGGEDVAFLLYLLPVVWEALLVV